MERFNNSDFSDRLKLAIKAADITQKDLADKVKVSKTAMNNYANGRIPEATILLRISKICNTSMEWLLTGECKDPILSNEVIESENITVKNLDPQNSFIQPKIFPTYSNITYVNNKTISMKSLLEKLLNDKSELKEMPATEKNIIELANYLEAKVGIEHNIALSKDQLNEDECEIIGLFNQLTERNKGRILATMEMMSDAQKPLGETSHPIYNNEEKTDIL